jgi:hypothetical protein
MIQVTQIQFTLKHDEFDFFQTSDGLGVQDRILNLKAW